MKHQEHLIGLKMLSRAETMVECPACRNWMVDRVCKYCDGSGEVTEEKARDFGAEP